MKFQSFLTLTLSSTFWALMALNPAYSMSIEETIPASILEQSNLTQQPILVEELPEQTEPITSVAISPTGNFVVSGSEDSTLKLWDLRAQQVMRTLHSHTEKVTSLMFSPNGRTLVSSSMDKTIKIWNLSMLRLKMTIYTNSEIHSIAVSPHGQTFASGNGDGTVEIWNLNTGKKRRQFNTSIQAPIHVTYSPDGKMLAARYSDRSGVEFWNPLTGELLATTVSDRILNSQVDSPESECGSWWQITSSLCGAIAQTPRGKLVANIDHQQVFLWRLPPDIQFTATTLFSTLK